MNSKLKTGLFALGLVVIIGGSSLAYTRLSAGREATELTQITPSIASEPEGSEAESSAPTPQASTKPVSTKAPDFTVYDAEGNTVNLSDFQGKPTVLNFWASWCPPCKKEMPDFDKVYAELGQDVNFVMVDLVDGSRETQEVGMEFIEEAGYSFPVYFDNDQAAAYAYNISAIPTTIFIDKDGHLVTGARSILSEEKLREGIQMAIDKE